MAYGVFKAARALVSGAAAALMVGGLLSAPVSAQENGKTVIEAEQYIPGIAITPDGCEVWMMDDGVEGYADNRLTRDGRPVCHRMNVCGVLNSDQFFATDSHYIGAGGKARLRDFFRKAEATAFIVYGHTDSRASDEYNMRLSYNRALSVARVARSVGAKVVDIRGYGERQPKASNATATGMAKNRRVEILCVQ